MSFRIADLARGFFRRSTRPTPAAHRTRLTLQTLEGREVPSGNPVAHDDTFASLHQGAPLTTLGSVLANDTGGAVPLKGYVTTPATAGTTFTFGSYGPNVRYKPRAGTIGSDGTITNAFVGTDSFQYVLKEGSYTSPPATATFAVTNTDPVANKTTFTFTAEKNKSFHIDTAALTGSDAAYDADGDTLGIVTADKTKTNTTITGTAGGRIWMNWVTGFSYNPPSSSFEGWDSFSYRLWDKAGFSDVVTAYVRVGDPTEPTAADNSYTTTTGQPLTVGGPGVLGNDQANGGPALTAVAQANAATAQDGRFTLAADGGFTYTPKAGFSGTDTFDYQATNGVTTSGSATVTITVKPVVTVEKVWDAEEAAGVAGKFRFTRTGDVSQALTVNYAVSGTATYGVDYQPLSGSVTFAARDAEAEVLVTPKADNLVETAETVQVALTSSAQSQYMIGTASQASLSITDDPPIVWIESGPGIVAEGQSGQIVLRRAGGDTSAEMAISLNVGPNRVGDPAVWGDHYTISGAGITAPGTSQVTFSSGSQTLTLSVVAVNDGLVDNTGWVGVSILGGAGYKVLDYAAAMDVAIKDQTLAMLTNAQIPPPDLPAPNLAPGAAPAGPFNPGTPGISAMSFLKGGLINVPLMTSNTAVVPAGGKLLKLQVDVTNVQLANNPLLVIPVPGSANAPAPVQDLAAINAQLGIAFAGGGMLRSTTTTNPANGSQGLVLKSGTLPAKTITVPIVLPNASFFQTGVLEYLTVTTVTITYQAEYLVGVSVPNSLAPAAAIVAAGVRPVLNLLPIETEWLTNP